MPLLTLKPLIIGTSILVGASLALYESHPQIRALIDSTAARIVDMFEEVLDALDAQLRLLTPQQREERRRRQRDRVRSAVLFDASTGQPVAPSAAAPAADIQMQPRSMDRDVESADQPAVGKASGVDISGADPTAKSEVSARAVDDERKAKRRRLWEMSEPAFQKPPSDSDHVNDSAIDVAEPSTQASQAQPDATGNFPDDAPPPYQPAEREDAMDDAASDGSSTSSFEAINTPTSGAPSAHHSRAPSVTPSDFINEDELSSGFQSNDEGEGDGDANEASTDTMSHVSGYSFASVSHDASGNQSDTESLGDADVISIASSGDDSDAMRT